MAMDEFVDATTDLWDIPTESATRIGHPAPFPVELPRRLIDLYTYRGDLVLDPFMGSGSTAVAAVRTERHYVGFDTDASYIALAERRVAEERAAGPPGRRVTVAPGRAAGTRNAGSADPAVARGHKARDIAQTALEAAGFTGLERGVAYGDLGVGVDFRARDTHGDYWLFELSGAYSATRPGLRRPDVLWRALGKSAVLHQARLAEPARSDLGPLVLLSTDRPAARSAGAKALAVVKTPDRSGPVHDVVELLDAESRARLTTYASGGHRPG